MNTLQRIISILTVVALSIQLAVIAQPAYASGSFYLSPNSATYTVGSTFTTVLVVGTGGQAINAGEGTITFSSDTLEATSVSKNGSVFTLWPVEPNVSGNKITFAGGLPTPGYSANGGLIISMTFKAKAVGTATVRVTAGRLLLNDGKGTNILTGYGVATYTIEEKKAVTTEPEKPKEPEKKEEEKPGERPPAPIIYSTMHPKQDVWYRDNNPEFVWDKLSSVTDFSYSFDDKAATVPDDISEGVQNTIKYAGTADGIWYIHVKAKNQFGWSDPGHYRVNIDVTPPLIFPLRLEGDTTTRDQTPNVYFQTTDATSGLDRYEFFVDGKIVESLKTTEPMPYTVPTLMFGTHSLLVRAYDKVGNYTDATLDLEIVKYYPGTGFKVGSVYILYIWIVIFQSLTNILLILLLLFLLLKRERRREEENQPKKSLKQKVQKN